MYLTACLCFVVASFFEFAVLFVMTNNNDMKKKRDPKNEVQVHAFDVKIERNEGQALKEDYSHFIRKIDNAAFFIFIFIFFLFNCYYWYKMFN